MCRFKGWLSSYLYDFEKYRPVSFFICQHRSPLEVNFVHHIASKKLKIKTELKVTKVETKTVMIVDDEPDVLDTVAQILIKLS